MFPLLWLLLVPGLQSGPSWTYASSPHFEVYTTGGEARAREALIYFERAHAFFGSYLKLTPIQTRPTRLIVFSGEKEYALYRPNEFATAYYQSSPDRDTIVMRSLEASTLTVVVHEYVHLLIRYSGERFPIWLNEGLAEFFSTVSPEAGRMSVGRVPIGRLQYLVNTRDALLPIDRLFDVTRDSREYTTRQHAGMFYAQSWALTHMLLSDARYNPQSSQFLAAIAGGMKAPAAFQTVYQRSLDAVFKDLQAYIKQGRYLYSRVAYKAPPQDEKLPTRQALAFEGGLVTATLLAANRIHEPEARAAFDALATQKPDDVMLLEARGYFELRYGGAQAAAPYFARAVALGSANPTLLRDYAVMLDSDPDKAEMLLTRSLSLEPANIETRVRLAYLYLTRFKTDAAFSTLASVTQVPPDEAVNFFSVLAQASARTGRLEDARRAVARATDAVRTDSERNQVEQLQVLIDGIAERQAIAGRPTVSEAFVQSVVAGRITNFVCDSGVLELSTPAGSIRLHVQDLKAVRVLASGSERPDLGCGPQDTAVRVGFDPASNAALKTSGIVKLLDFRK